MCQPFRPYWILDSTLLLILILGEYSTSNLKMSLKSSRFSQVLYISSRIHEKYAAYCCLLLNIM